MRNLPGFLLHNLRIVNWCAGGGERCRIRMAHTSRWVGWQSEEVIVWYWARNTGLRLFIEEWRDGLALFLYPDFRCVFTPSFLRRPYLQTQCDKWLVLESNRCFRDESRFSKMVEYLEECVDEKSKTDAHYAAENEHADELGNVERTVFLDTRSVYWRLIFYGCIMALILEATLPMLLPLHIISLLPGKWNAGTFQKFYRLPLY